MKKMVVFTDICSSSVIVEGLSEDGNIGIWKTHLNQLFAKIEEKRSVLDFEVYKFIGDGWVLLFNPELDNKLKILSFFTELCKSHIFNFKNSIEEYLGAPDYKVGLTFGLFIGNVYPIEIQKNTEYVGESLNIAARFQSLVQTPNDSTDDPSNKLLMYYPQYTKYFKDQLSKDYIEKMKSVDRTLRNIRHGRTWRCARIDLL